MKTIFEKPFFDLPPAHPDCPDPVHREDHLWRGIDTATERLGFSLEDIRVLFRHHRPAAIAGLASIGAAVSDGAYISSAVGCLRGMLLEAKERFG